jgi:hypothetical protein
MVIDAGMTVVIRDAAQAATRGLDLERIQSCPAEWDLRPSSRLPFGRRNLDPSFGLALRTRWQTNDFVVFRWFLSWGC